MRRCGRRSLVKWQFVVACSETRGIQQPSRFRERDAAGSGVRRDDRLQRCPSFYGFECSTGVVERIATAHHVTPGVDVAIAGNQLHGAAEILVSSTPTT